MDIKKYLVILTAPSHHFMGEEENYIEPFIVQQTEDNISNYVDERLMRQFSCKYNVPLNSVRVLCAATVK